MIETRRKSDGGRRLPRIVCVVGPTSSGKTDLGICLAQRLDGEIVNADSRQLYRGISVGTGKPPGTWKAFDGGRAFFVKDVPHHLMDFLDPRKPFTVVEWRERAERAIHGILRRGRLPVIVGGTGLYVRALVDNFQFPKVEPKTHLRDAFRQKSLPELVALLVRLDPAAGHIVDLQNPRRVVRALEVATFTGKPVSELRQTGAPKYDAFQVGIRWEREELYARIEAEVDAMIDRGWVEEIRDALERGLPSDAPAFSSIGYKELVAYLRGARTLDDAIRDCTRAVRRYAKRQETWFRRDARIHWVRDADEASRCVGEWLRESA